MDSSFPPNYDSTVFTDDENSSRMSDLDSEKEFNSSRSSDRMSIDERSKPSRKWTSFEQPKLRLQDELMGETSKKKIVKGPERRSVNRRSSLLPKSKALMRVIDQAEEDTHLADIEMRRENETTRQIKTSDSESPSEEQQDVPAAAWTRVVDPYYYQCSKLNPEMEMTNFQLENLPSPIQQSFRSIKRKASEDRFEPYPSMGLKRRAVSPSMSLTGSPVLTAVSSPPTLFTPFGSSHNNAAARAQQKPAQLASNPFNLHDASGSLSRMTLSE